MFDDDDDDFSYHTKNHFGFHNPMGNSLPNDFAKNILDQEGFTQNAVDREFMEHGTTYISDFFGGIFKHK